MTITLTKYSNDGKESGNVSVSDTVFGIEPNVHVLNLAVLRELANARNTVAHTKTRSEVRGGGRKPWKQKGTGRARAGSIRSPLWVGGGVIFGPRSNVNYTKDLPKKVRKLAIRSSLSSAKSKFHVFSDFSFLSGPKTKEMVEVLKKLNLYGKKILILAHYKAEENQHLKLAARNIDKVTLRLPSNLSVRDLLHVDAVVATESAVQEINERYAADVN